MSGDWGKTFERLSSRGHPHEERPIAARPTCAMLANQVVDVMAEFYGLTVEEARRTQIVELAHRRAGAA